MLGRGRGNRRRTSRAECVGSDRGKGSQLIFISRHRDRAVDDRLFVSGGGVEHGLRDNGGGTTEANAVLFQAERNWSALEGAIDDLLRAGKDGGITPLLGARKLILGAELALIGVGGDPPVP